MHEPTSAELTFAEKQLDAMDSAFRDYYGESGLEGRVPEGENPGDTIETYLFAFGLMASIFRSTRAVMTLTRDGFAVECRPIFRSILDQVLALYSVNTHGVHAVHAYGKELAYNYSKLLKASKHGFPLGADSEAYIEKFLDLAGGLPSTAEGKRAENAIKTFQAGNEAGPNGAAVYQMWLEATPLSKPSMRLSDAYVQPVQVGKEFKMSLYFDSDPGSVVDARLVLSTVLPLAMKTFAEIVNDQGFDLKATEFGEAVLGSGRGRSTHT